MQEAAKSRIKVLAGAMLMGLVSWFIKSTFLCFPLVKPTHAGFLCPLEGHLCHLKVSTLFN